MDEPVKQNDPPSQEGCDHDYDEPTWSGPGGPTSVRIRRCRKCGYREEVTVPTPPWMPGGRP